VSFWAPWISKVYRSDTRLQSMENKEVRSQCCQKAIASHFASESLTSIWLKPAPTLPLSLTQLSIEEWALSTKWTLEIRSRTSWQSLNRSSKVTPPNVFEAPRGSPLAKVCVASVYCDPGPKSADDSWSGQNATHKQTSMGVHRRKADGWCFQ
jgi:hypothetical protein